MVWRTSIGLFLLAAIAACQLDNQPALRVGANIWPGYEPFYLARRLGYYDERTINLVDFSSSVEVMRAYRNGVIDVAALTADEALSIIATEPGAHKVILVTDFSDGADCILAQRAFTTFEQLRGRRIGVESNALGAYVLLRALRLHHMAVEDIMPVPMALEQHEAAFKAKYVDAIVTFEPRCSSLLSGDAREVFSSKEIPGEVVDILLARRSLVETRTAALVQLARGWFASLARLEREPTEAATIAAAHQGVSAESFLKLLRGLTLANRGDNLRLLGDDPRGLTKTLKTLSLIMHDEGLLPGAVEVEGVLDRRIVEQAQP